MNVLLIEDNEADRLIVKEAFSTVCGSHENLYMVEDSQKAQEFLSKKEPFQESPQPDLILLDLNLPGKSGRELLSELKVGAATKNIPIIVLTSSNSQEDICYCYSHRANCFITKPTRYTELLRLMDLIHAFWLKTVSLCRAEMN